LSPEKKKKAADSAAEPSLEESLARLEGIVGELESGKADLEKSIDLYIEGKRLGEKALKKLDALDKKIQIVSRDDGEEMEVEDFQ
jgi:exodeoxyribonuclease VII small subunit